MTIMAERVGVGARDIIDHFLDEGTFRSWDVPALDVPANGEYAEMLRIARAGTGLDESVITGEGTLRGRRVAVMAGEFAFLGGSIGVAATESLCRPPRTSTLMGFWTRWWHRRSCPTSCTGC
jgi:acetyl-CoA carboxylase carboxyl transferase subunit beta